MIDRPPALPYEAAHAEVYKLGVLADLASHEYDDDLEKYGHAEPAHASSGWRPADTHPPATSGTCSVSSDELRFLTQLLIVVSDQLGARAGEAVTAGW